jgi:hypothetical protein
VWDVLVDPLYAPKLYRDVLFMEVSPLGKGKVGQKRTAMARAGRTKIQIRGIVTEATRPEKFVLRQMPGALFDVYTEEFRLSGTGTATEVKADFEYVVSLEYVHGALNIALLENAVASSLGGFLKNLKELAELRPI